MAVRTEDDFITRVRLVEIVCTFAKNLDEFYDIFENNGAGPRFDCLTVVGEHHSNTECYIVDRETGHYVNWYKAYHFGRSYTTNMQTEEEVMQFFASFFLESKKPWNSED